MKYFRQRVKGRVTRELIGLRARFRLWRELRDGRDLDLRRYAFSRYSQDGEDGMLEAIFRVIGPTNRYFVEFGASDGMLHSNTARLELQQGWRGLLLEGDVHGIHRTRARLVHKAIVTAENIEQLFEEHGVPATFDLLSIDIDGNDYWVWKALTHYHPRVVMIEYNSRHAGLFVTPYDPHFVWDGAPDAGASLASLTELAEQKGYCFVGVNPSGINAFFMQQPLAEAFAHICTMRGIPRP